MRCRRVARAVRDGRAAAATIGPLLPTGCRTLPMTRCQPT
jgi:hypothetical protein